MPVNAFIIVLKVFILIIVNVNTMPISITGVNQSSNYNWYLQCWWYDFESIRLAEERQNGRACLAEPCLIRYL